MSTLLAYRPFLDALDLHDAWYVLLFPLALLIAVAYKAVRVPDMRHYPRHVLVMAAQISIAMIALGAAAYAFVEILLPLIAPKA